MKKQILLSFLGLIFAILFSELVLRILVRYSTNIGFFTQNPYQQTYLVENEKTWQGITSIGCSYQYPGGWLNGFILNDKGFQTPNYSYEKPKKMRRIIFIGDSQTVSAVPYTQGFVEVLQKKIPGVQIINLGVICVGPATEKQILKYEGILYEPDLIIEVFFVGNDFTDDKEILRKYKTIRKKTYLFPFWVYQSKPFSLLRNIRLYTIEKRTSPVFKQNTKQTGYDTGTYLDFDPTKPNLTEKEYLKLLLGKSDLFYPNSSIYDDWSKIQQYFLEMKQIANSHNSQFLVVIIPDELQVDTVLQQKAADEIKTTVAEWDTAYPQRLITSFLSQNKIEYIDVLNTLAVKTDAFHQYFLPRDTHLNKEGNQIVADILNPKILELLRKNEVDLSW